MTLAPEPGRLLLASPLLLDPNFYQAAVLLVSHDNEGSFGLVLNQEHPGTLGEGLGGNCPEPLRDVKLANGGPVDPSSFFCLHNNLGPYDNAQEIVPGVFIGAEENILDTFAFDAHPTELQVRFFCGYSGWGSGQLDGEVEEGSWICATSVAQDILGDPKGLWERKINPDAQPGSGPAGFN